MTEWGQRWERVSTEQMPGETRSGQGNNPQHFTVSLRHCCHFLHYQVSRLRLKGHNDGWNKTLCWTGHAPPGPGWCHPRLWPARRHSVNCASSVGPDRRCGRSQLNWSQDHRTVTARAEAISRTATWVCGEPGWWHGPETLTSCYRLVWAELGVSTPQHGSRLST